jgi:hypothetical protein
MNIKTNIIISAVVGVTALFSPLASLAQAYEAPSFPSCSSPAGSVRASYNSGDHGIAGDNNKHAGSDVVYNVAGGNQVLQCFCGSDSNGVQTKWLKVTGLSDADRNDLLKDGWVFVANGSLWGLDSDPYMALNANYTCGVGGSVLGIEDPGQVLGLADTGRTRETLLFAAACCSLLSGFFLVSKSRRESK